MFSFLADTNFFFPRGFSLTETLCSEHKYFCETCKSKQEAQKRFVNFCTVEYNKVTQNRIAQNSQTFLSELSKKQ